MKRNKKRLLAMLVAASMALSSGACGTSKKEEPELKIRGQKVQETDGTAYYLCDEDKIIEEIIKQIYLEKKAGYTLLNVESILDYDGNGAAYIDDEHMGVVYDTNQDIIPDEIYFCDTNYKTLVDNIFDIENDAINIAPIYSAIELNDESGYGILLLGLNETKTEIYNGVGALYIEEGFEYTIENGIVMGYAEVSEEKAKELFTKYLRIFMNNPFWVYDEEVVIQKQNNGIQLVLSKKEHSII